MSRSVDRPAAGASPAGASRRRVIAEVLIAAMAAVFIATGVLANQPWLDRHFMPSFFLMRRTYVALESCVRVALALVGLAIAFVVRPRVGRAVARNPGGVIAVVVSVVLAIAASDVVLAWMRPSTEWLFGREEPLRQPDARLGWTFVPNRTGHKTIGGRVIDYTFDAAGDRVRTPGDLVDPNQPTILFIGESVMSGEGLTWDESIPAQTGALLGLQSANIAVYGYATDQAYLRLEDALPRFHRPVAVVSLFMTALFGRNLDDDRPHLGPDLIWLPPVPRGRLASLVKLVVPFRRESTVERGIAATRDVLRATANLARAHGATPLVVVPQFNHEDEIEHRLRQRILDEGGVPYMFVEFDQDWRLPGDVHPNARTAHAIAEAVAARLQAAVPH